MISDEELLKMWDELVEHVARDSDDWDERRLAFFHMIRTDALAYAARLCGGFAEGRKMQANEVPRLTVSQQHAGQWIEAKRSEAMRCADAIIRAIQIPDEI